MTRFLLTDGIGEVKDFMPIASRLKKNVIVRKVSGIKGEIKYRMQCCPRFNYARSTHESKLNKNEIFFTSNGEDGLCLKLTSSIPLHLRNGDGYAEFTLKAGETAEFILENIEDNEISIINSNNFVETTFTDTLNYWKTWSAKSTYKGRWREMVMRSALVLKLLISDKYGSIIAAPTFSLPEKIGEAKIGITDFHGFVIRLSQYMH